MNRSSRSNNRRSSLLAIILLTVLSALTTSCKSGIPNSGAFGAQFGSNDTISAVLSSSELPRNDYEEWIIDSHFLSDTITLVKYKNRKPKQCELVHFSDSGTINFRYSRIEPRCGNGMVSFDSSSSWRFNSDQSKLTVDLKILYASMGVHSRTVEYKIDTLHPDTLRLVQTRLLYSKDSETGPYVSSKK